MKHKKGHFYKLSLNDVIICCTKEYPLAGPVVDVGTSWDPIGYYSDSWNRDIFTQEVIPTEWKEVPQDSEDDLVSELIGDLDFGCNQERVKQLVRNIVEKLGRKDENN